MCVCPPDAAIQVDRMIRLFFKALGWQLSTDEAKDHAFCSKFQALGVEFDLSTMHQGYFSVGNTPSRKAELSSRIDDILGADLLSVAEADVAAIKTFVCGRSSLWKIRQSGLA